MSEFRKDDTGKLRLDLIPASFERGLALALQMGAVKYGDYNYLAGEGGPYARYYAAARRHMLAWWERQDKDDESGLHHLHHAAACLAILVHLIDEGRGVDDRPN